MNELIPFAIAELTTCLRHGHGCKKFTVQEFAKWFFKWQTTGRMQHHTNHFFNARWRRRYIYLYSKFTILIKRLLGIMIDYHRASWVDYHMKQEEEDQSCEWWYSTHISTDWQIKFRNFAKFQYSPIFVYLKKWKFARFCKFCDIPCILILYGLKSTIKVAIHFTPLWGVSDNI